MTKAERLELIRKIAKKYENVEFEKKENPNEQPTEAIVLDASIPVSRQEIVETANEELDALREDERDRQTESEAITSDEK